MSIIKSVASAQFASMALVFLLSAAYFGQPTFGAPQRQSRLLKVPRMAAEQQQEPIEQQQLFGTNNQQRLFFPSRMASWNDWSSDPDQILSLKRASLLARLATQSARGFGRK